MVPMGALQPGMPTPVAIPRGYAKVTIVSRIAFFLFRFIMMTAKDLPFPFLLLIK